VYKLTNPLLILDLEATAGTDEKGFQTNNFIIDIGAVLLDTQLQELGQFSRLVKPGEEISEFITQLTGISNEMVREEPEFSQVGRDFHNWIKELQVNPKKLRLAAWGNYFDIPLLRRTYQHYHMDFPFSGTALDIKTLAFTWLAMSGRRTDRFNVQSMAELLGIEAPGRFHRAIVDATVEGEIFKRIWSDLQGFFLPGKEGAYTHYAIKQED